MDFVEEFTDLGAPEYAVTGVYEAHAPSLLY
jgi:hypothetical protein